MSTDITIGILEESIADIIVNNNLLYNKLSKETIMNNFLEKNLYMNARSLLYLNYEIEKKYNITIPSDEIVKGNFNTIRNISQIIFNKISMLQKL